MAAKDQRPSWVSAVAWLISPLVLILGVRWLLIEPYVIPSGSMLPNLLIHDHILVNKLRFGVRVPFGKTWLVHWGEPRRGEIVVFRFPENPEVFFVKRLIGLPGDKISIKEGVVHVNGVPLKIAEAEAPAQNPDDADEGGEENDFSYYTEENHLIRYLAKENANLDELEVPVDSYFMMGDNRDQSNDSRSWGPVPQTHLIGTPFLIWLSCSETLESARFLCDPSRIRWNRLLIKVP